MILFFPLALIFDPYIYFKQSGRIQNSTFVILYYSCNPTTRIPFILVLFRISFHIFHSITSSLLDLRLLLSATFWFPKRLHLSQRHLWIALNIFNGSDAITFLPINRPLLALLSPNPNAPLSLIVLCQKTRLGRNPFLSTLQMLRMLAMTISELLQAYFPLRHLPYKPFLTDGKIFILL